LPYFPQGGPEHFVSPFPGSFQNHRLIKEYMSVTIHFKLLSLKFARKEMVASMSTLRTLLSLILLFSFLFFMGGFLAAQESGGSDGGLQERPKEVNPPDLPADEGFIEAYSLGSQTFTINAGLIFPLFFYFPGAGEVDNLSTFEAAWGQLSLGGMGSLSWGSYITPRFALGAKLSGTFAFTPTGYVHSLIPITMWTEYLFRSGSFEFPVSLQAGVVINRVQDQGYFGGIVIPGMSGYYNLNAEWGLGLSLDYYWVPEIYFGDRANYTGFGNHLELSFSARYHFS
jgi:hypothetical protein